MLAAKNFFEIIVVEGRYARGDDIIVEVLSGSLAVREREILRSTSDSTCFYSAIICILRRIDACIFVHLPMDGERWSQYAP